MPIDIGLVFSNALAMVKERWLAMLGLWATFLGFLLVYGLVFFAVIGGSMLAMTGMAMGTSAFEDPAALGGLGMGVLLLALLFYIGYLAILFGQQGAMVAAATPLERISFGEAFGRGLKSGLTMLGIMVLFLIAYVVVLLVMMLVGLILSFLGTLGGILTALIAVAGVAYFACRFSVLIPVIVVERTYNPITAINRTWQITSGKVLSILVVLVVATVAAMIVIIPVFLILGGVFDPAAGGAEPGMLSILFAFVLLIVMSFAILFFYSSLIASLHAQVSDRQAVEFGKTFE